MLLNFDYYWRKVKTGDVQAFEKIFRAVFPNLSFYVQQILNDEYAAEEIVQEMFIRIWEQRSKINIRGSVKSYFYQMAHNSAINYLLQQKTLKISAQKTASGERWREISENSGINAYLIEKLEADDTERIIRSIIDHLPDQSREIFILSRFENKSNEEIAQIKQISVNTVRTQIYRALEKIREGLDKKF